MKNWESCKSVERNPDKVSGEWIFKDTRIPVSTLFENLKDGASIKQYLEWFPGVRRKQIEDVLDHEVESLKEPVQT